MTDDPRALTERVQRLEKTVELVVLAILFFGGIAVGLLIAVVT